MKRYHIIFKGRVQGVGFRYTSKLLASMYNLTGSVENLYNGDVEVYIQGDNLAIEKFINDINDQRHIYIESMDKNEIAVKKDESSYNIVG